MLLISNTWLLTAALAAWSLVAGLSAVLLNLRAQLRNQSERLEDALSEVIEMARLSGSNATLIGSLETSIGLLNSTTTEALAQRDQLLHVLTPTQRKKLNLD